MREDERLKEDLKDLVAFDRKEALRAWSMAAQKWEDLNFLCYFLEESMELVFRGSHLFKVKLHEKDFIESYLNQDINEFISGEFWECVMINRAQPDDPVITSREFVVFTCSYEEWEVKFDSDKGRINIVERLLQQLERNKNENKSRNND